MFKRKSIRLRGWDYACEGAYFVTLIAQNRECLFGDIMRGKMHLNKSGEIVRDEWLLNPVLRKNIIIDEFIIMPNHFHGIVIITENLGKNIRDMGTRQNSFIGTRSNFESPSNTLGSVIRGFKGVTTKQINSFRNYTAKSVWQRNYFDRVIRNEKEFNSIREYIFYNPLLWEFEKDNPGNINFNIINNKTNNNELH